ncbi:hypothetical protein BGZ65_008830, partial [Modicella reniformis]
MVLCHDAESALSQAKSATKKYPIHPNDARGKALSKEISAAYIDLGKLLDGHGYRVEAQAILKKTEKWGGNAQQDPGRLAQYSSPNSIAHSNKNAPDSTAGASAENLSADRLKQPRDIVTISPTIFAVNVRLPVSEHKLPEADEHLTNTPQLAYCLNLLQYSQSPDETLDPAARNWLQAIENDTDEQDRLKTLVKDVIRAFKRDELKDAKAVTEVVYLTPVLEKDDFRYMLKELCSGIDQSILLDVHELEGLAQLIHGADPGYVEADDLVKILELLNTRLKGTHHQSPQHIYQLTMAVSRILDAMADTNVKDLDREKLHEPLSSYLNELKGSSDPYLVYQAAYAHQALLCVPDNETLWQGALRRTGKVIKGVSGLVSAVKALDLNQFIEGLGNIQQGFAGASEAFRTVKTAYDGITNLARSGQTFVECLKEGLGIDHKCAWYSALRGADALIREGELATFKKLVCEAPCRRDPAFQWGVCQRLGEIAANPMWDTETRRSAVRFLGEIYQNDTVWGQHTSVKQWILDILMQLASQPGNSLRFNSVHSTIAEVLLRELETSGDTRKQAIYRECREKGSALHPLTTASSELASPSLLNRVQNIPDVEGNLRLLRKQRLSEQVDAIYIPPQAKASLQATDDTRFPLMEKVKEFLSSDQKVFLLLGDSGAGKSTFDRALECDLWKTYKSKTGRIPLHINLPAIDRPEYDMIAKHLRKAEFTEPQIKEMKLHRNFILICDGYDESQLIHNL